MEQRRGAILSMHERMLVALHKVIPRDLRFRIHG